MPMRRWRKADINVPVLFLVHDSGDRCRSKKMGAPYRAPPKGGCCRWCAVAFGSVNLHAQGLPQFIIPNCFTLCVCRFTVFCLYHCVCMFVCVHYDGDILWQNDHTHLPTAPGSLSFSTFLPPTTPQRSTVLPHMSNPISLWAATLHCILFFLLSACSHNLRSISDAKLLNKQKLCAEEHTDPVTW